LNAIVETSNSDVQSRVKDS